MLNDARCTVGKKGLPLSNNLIYNKDDQTELISQL